MIPEHMHKGTFPTGSSYICNPPVTNTDIDQVFFVYHLGIADEQMRGLGWTVCGPDHYPNVVWKAYRKGNLNALLTDNCQHFLKMYHATEVAKKLNLLNKADRIALFKSIIEGT